MLDREVLSRGAITKLFYSKHHQLTGYWASCNNWQHVVSMGYTHMRGWIDVDLNASPPNLGRSDQSRHQNQTDLMMANSCWIPPPEQDLISSCDKKKPKKSSTSSIDFFSRRLLPLPIAPDPKAMARMTIWPVVTLSSNVHWKFVSSIVQYKFEECFQMFTGKWFITDKQ